MNARNGEFNLNDFKGLLDACARGFSEHPQQPKAAPASAFDDVYLQCRNCCHGPDLAMIASTSPDDCKPLQLTVFGKPPLNIFGDGIDQDAVGLLDRCRQLVADQ